MRQFHDQLQDLLQKVIRMGSLAESMIQKGMEGLAGGNASLAADIFERERQVNALQVEVDDAAVKLTILQQPVARDARFLFMASRIAGDLERIADQAVNITQNAGHMLDQPPLKTMVELPLMAQVARKMVRDSLSAMIDCDVALANQILTDEKQVDALRDHIFSALLASMTADPRLIRAALSLILIARNLERIGDHATNIAEEVIYWIQGRDVRHGQALRAGSNAPHDEPGQDDE
jgi:phosphate transport system protein